MLIHELGSSGKKTKQRVGRGGKRGTFSGRGTKGQKARSGRRIRPQLRDILKKIPKRRGRGKQGFRPFGKKPVGINISILEKHFNAGETISPKLLADKGLLRLEAKKVPAVKLLASGEVTKKFLVEGFEISKAAQGKIEKAGGTVKSNRE